ncbi:hypothetical protein ASE36_15455 [Rhizobium sp. Root274]|uniref:Transmembrane protein n=1 Tax=Agrobacterium albertimagni AOL15 TaxID=1156935 RepID=K2QVW9_9HYPH|nr:MULTISPECIES: hypothetical protein [Rhizobium/Agrobacterium group]EKF59397.1 hypothetical protein QWE_11381 [Agrobacterium albertimagni AOL15]KQW27873.1 hypothetical protein ASC71_15485 [Rhizobium sp. Root1240]KRD28154.1 hypothetical protein ASE36_15455 [Rhizobium sp. Root274]
MIDLDFYQYVDFHNSERVAMIVTALVALAIFMRLLHLPKVWMKVVANLIFFLVCMHAVGFTLIGIAAWQSGT